MSSVPFQCLSPCRVGTILLLWWQAALSDLRKTLQEENLASAKAEAGQRSQVTQQLEDQLSTIKYQYHQVF